METVEPEKSKASVRKRAEAIKSFRCKNLIAVIKDPTDIKNIGTVIRNANALGFSSLYFVVRTQWPGAIWLSVIAIYALSVPLVLGLRLDKTVPVPAT